MRQLPDLGCLFLIRLCIRILRPMQDTQNLKKVVLSAEVDDVVVYGEPANARTVLLDAFTGLGHFRQQLKPLLNRSHLPAGCGGVVARNVSVNVPQIAFGTWHDVKSPHLRLRSASSSRSLSAMISSKNSPN